MDNELITFTGRSDWALVNSYWAILFHDGISFDSIHVISTRQEIDDVKKALKEVSRNYGFTPSVKLNHLENDLDVKKPAKVVEEINSEQNNVFINITPAKKVVASSALIKGIASDVEKIYYLHIDEVSNASYPYFDIPFSRQDLVELIKGEVIE
ncbi:hypothetical protein C9439_00160 [archaeon SCG-AAA382B04]|nr:hypothetical protein C9439_00160 [archaeon SCG-AAA382B04]